MPPLRRILKTLAGLLAYGVYVWFAAVNAVGGVKRRKAARRAARLAGRA